MKCPQCQTENPDGFNFCGECGLKFGRVCPNCNSVNPLHFSFCGECGHPLSLPANQPPRELPFDEKLRKIQKYLPSGLVKKILAHKGKIEGERRQVTVMFCDMEAFTAFTEKVGHEEAYALVDQIYEILIDMVHQYEGTVNEMTGDGILALFGAPIALEDAPQRAIRSAFAIHRELAKFSDRLMQQRGLPPIRMRIGLHTGPVVVGTVGNDLRVKFTAVGDTVNLASRMEDLAEPGATYVTESTFRLTEGIFRFEALGEKEIKGKEGLVNVYRVIAPSNRRTRFEVSAERGLTPFLGRDREIDLLLDGYKRARAGRGQAFFIVSDAGVGKSRLLYEFRKAVTNEDVTFFEGRCLSYSRGVAYHPIIDILKSNFNIHEGDGDSAIREKVSGGLKILGLDESSSLPYLLELLAVKDSGIDNIHISPEGKRDQIIKLLNRIALSGSQIRTLIIAVEDLHWIDRSSEELLNQLIDSIPGARVLLIFTHRPDFVYTGRPKSFVNHLNLNRLSNRESLAMANHLLGGENIDKNLEDLILEKAEGVPFFIEELLKSMKDLKIIEHRDSKYQLAKDVQTVAIPSTIQDVIMARVDSLPDAAKTLLQTSSLIEREFSYDLIKRVTGLPEQTLLTNLSALKDAELLYERGIYPQTSYIFRHALIREVVYDSILTKKRKNLHEEIGKVIEETHENNLDEYYGILAEHFIASENYEKGADYARLAAKKAEKLVSFSGAISYAQKRVACLGKLPPTEEVKKKVIDARTVLGIYMSQMSYIREAKEAIDPIIDLAFKSDDKKRLSQLYIILGIYHYMVEENFPEALKHLEEALVISEEVRDIFSSVFVNHLLGLVLSWNCEFAKTVHYIEKALKINEAAKNIWGVSVMKSNLSVYAYDYQGMVDLGHKTSEEALRMAEDCADILPKSMAYTSHGISCFYKGFLREAENYLLRGIEFSEGILLFSHAALGHQWLGHVYCELKDFGKSLDQYGNAIHLREQSRLFPSSIKLNKVAAARVKVLNNERDVDLEALYRYADENRVKLHEGSMARYIGEILLHLGDRHFREAGEWIHKAIAADSRNRLIWDLGKDYALWAEFLKRKGDPSKAKEELDRAKEIFQKCGADGWVEKIKVT
jgi:class 3 adenylate cyclase/tetratricopeptide (TPR) repeat protein